MIVAIFIDTVQLVREIELEQMQEEPKYALYPSSDGVFLANRCGSKSQNALKMYQRDDL